MRYNLEKNMQPFRKNVSCMFAIYWAILVFWQNIGEMEARSSVDMIIKIGLLAYFVWFYVRRARKVSVKIVWVIILTASLLVTAAGEAQFPLSNVIAYAYPIIFLTMVYGLGDRMEISRQHLIAFCNCVIAVTLYAALYSIIFCWDQFAYALTINKAYGNELTSFFLSSHEYGMYLACAIVSCGICLKLDPKLTRKKKVGYCLAIAVFFVNLVLTFSRTSLLGLLFFLLMYVWLGKGRLKRWIVYFAVLAAAIVLFSSDLRNYLFDVVMKANALSGRAEMLRGGLAYYSDGSIFEKVFGHGLHDIRNYYEWTHAHGSAHNAYLQVLLNYGLIAALSLVLFIIGQIFISIRFIKTDRFLGAVHLGLIAMAALMMFTNTAIIFTSPIDSYFLTIFMFIVPKYVRNAIIANRFY